MKKKALAVILAAAMAASFVGCGKEATTSTTAAAGEETTVSADEETGTEGETEAEEDEEVPYFSAFDYEDITKYCVLGEYKGIKVPEVDTTVTDEDVQEALEEIVEEYNTSNPQYEEITDRPVEDGDVINLDYSGVLEGETDPFDGGTAEDQLLTIGSGTFIDGFEEGLIGVMPGEEVELDLTFPEDYASTDYAGKNATFTCTVNYIQGDQIMYELSDDFINTYTEGEYTTIAEYTEYERQVLEEQAVSDAQDTDVNYYWEKVIANSEYPEEPTEVIEGMEYFYKYYSFYIYGYDVASYAEMAGQTEDEINEQIHESAVSYAQFFVTICAIIKAEQAELSEDEIETKLQELAESEGSDLDSLKEYYDEGYLKDCVYREEIWNWIIDNMVVSADVETEAETTAAAEE